MASDTTTPSSPPIVAKTGTSTRVQSLPIITHIVTNTNNSKSKVNLEFGPTVTDLQRITTPLEQQRLRGENATSRCVYHYEDRYRFCRILSASDLVFDSHFESGNLLKARRISFGDKRDLDNLFHEYDIELHHDIHSVGHRQWFYFRCSNVIAGQQVKFNITNLAKSDSLFNYGMKPLMFSETDATSGTGWMRVGENVRYYPNSKTQKKKRLYTLTFTHTFEHSGDTCFFAYGYPYTYTEMQQFLNSCEANPEKSAYFTRELLCKTLAGNNCDLLTITEPAEDEDELKKREGVVISARVHPGETNASWICEGIIDFLLGQSEDALLLRSNYIFKIIPMLNPDGVINGNYRTSMAGVDLNRQWHAPHPIFHPTIYNTKQMVREFQKVTRIATLCDIHGHSRKEGLFMYGCIPEFRGIRDLDANGQQPTGGSPVSVLTFPRLYDQTSEFFDLFSCNFKMQRSKAPTMRMVMHTELDVECAYTLEASFSGINGKHFSSDDLKAMGHHYCMSLVELRKGQDNGFGEKTGIVGESFNSGMKRNSTQKQGRSSSVSFPIYDKGGPESEGSDSDPSGDNLTKKEIMKLLARTKKSAARRRKKKRKNRRKSSVITTKRKGSQVALSSTTTSKTDDKKNGESKIATTTAKRNSYDVSRLKIPGARTLSVVLFPRLDNSSPVCNKKLPCKLRPVSRGKSNSTMTTSGASVHENLTQAHDSLDDSNADDENIGKLLSVVNLCPY